MFVPLRIYSDYSLLESCIRIPELVELAAKHGYSYLSLTDHNTTAGLVEFYQHCQKHQIAPILGLDLDVAGFASCERVVLLAENKLGYLKLQQLASLPKPVAISHLEKHNQGLICLINVNKLEAASSDYRQFVKVFGMENVYFQLPPPKNSEYQLANKLLDFVSEEQLVTSPAIKYLTEEQHPVLQVLQALKANGSLDEVNITASSFSQVAEIADSYRSFPQALKNSWEIAKRCKVVLQPELTLPQLSSSLDLRELVFAGAAKRFTSISEKVSERLEYELAVIKEMGLADYFLLVQDIVRFAKNAKIPVGPGRGSAAGSLVAYCLEITEIDPLEHNLFFERFLNRERQNLPDIDLDFCSQRRDEVIAYVVKRFGEQHVAKIGAYGTFGESLATKEVKKLVRDQQQAALIIKQLVGLKHHFTTHAAGLVITPEPIINYSSLQPNTSQPVTQMDMNSLEYLGVLKIDLLSLRNLTILADIEQSVKFKEPDFSLEQLPLSDQATFKLLTKGQTLGVFQLESSLFRDLLPQMQPASFADLVALLALGRPGPLRQVPSYIRRREQKEKIEYLHPSLEPILSETYGLMLYQEQVMQVAHEIAGFSLEEADLLRVAISKKDHQLLGQLKARFITGCQAQGLSNRDSRQLYTQIESFADYAFNKAHSAAYSLITWQTAYLKANYPLEFYLTLLRHTDSLEKRQEIFLECFTRNISILSPDVRFSEIDFTKEGQSIRIGLASLKYLGRAQLTSIITQRAEAQFTSLGDFLQRVAVNFNVAENLVYAGALDCFGSRTQLLAEIGAYFQTTIPALTNLELLEREKEIVGIYLSEHPLSGWKVFLNYLTENLGQCIAGQVIAVKSSYQQLAGKLAGEQQIYNFTMRRNQYQAFLQKQHLVALFGRFENSSFKVDWVLPLKPMLILQPKLEQIHQLQEFFKRHQGTTPVLLNVQAGTIQLVDPQFWLGINQELLKQLKDFCISVEWIDPWQELGNHYRK